MTGKHPKEDKSVTCVGRDVRNCKFNDISGSICTAERINVQNKAAMNKSETFCDTFIPKGSF